MALQVWLPLNGSIENQGLLGVNMNGGPASWASGKMGNCAVFSGSQLIYTDNTNALDYLDDFTWCCWVNLKSGTSTSYDHYIFTVGRVDYGSYGYGANYTGDTTIYIHYGTLGWTVSTSGANTWNHIAFTKKGAAIKIYVNGVLKVSETFNGVYPTFEESNGLGIGAFHFTAGTTYHGSFSMNDFRIYDNALSEREVHEIAKGLVIHYPLNQYEKEANLCPNSYINETSSAYGFATRPVNLTAGKTYTLLVNGRVIDGDGCLATYIFKEDWSEANNRRITNKEDTTFSMPFTPKTTGTYYICSYSFLEQSTAGGNVHVNWYKLVEGTIYSGIWSPSKSDVINWEGIEYDTSGFGNHGSISGTIKLALDSPRNDCCYKFNNMNYISAKTPWGANAVSELTISLWINQISGGPYSTFLASHGYGGDGLWLGMNVESWGQWSFRGSHSPHYARGGEGNISTNTWHHFVYKFKDGTVTWYRNGNKLASTKYDDSVLNLSNVIALGNSYNGNSWDTSFEGKISDFRLYATALSDKDIAELYNTPMCITNTGALMTQGEFKEV